MPYKFVQFMMKHTVYRMSYLKSYKFSSYFQIGEKTTKAIYVTAFHEKKNSIEMLRDTRGFENAKIFNILNFVNGIFSFTKNWNSLTIIVFEILHFFLFTENRNTNMIFNR